MHIARISLKAGIAVLLATTGAAANGNGGPEGTGFWRYDWSGIYIGAQGGWLWGQNDVTESFELTEIVNIGPLNYDSDGYVVGGVVGLNLQTGNWVYGGEVDMEYANVSGERPRDVDGFLREDVNITSSLRFRGGYALGGVLLYGTAGLAVASVEMEATSIVPFEFISDNQTTFGYTAGGGIEVALWSNWSVAAEYRYSDYGATDQSGEIFLDDFLYQHTNKFHAVRGRLNYRWGI